MLVDKLQTKIDTDTKAEGAVEETWTAEDEATLNQLLETIENTYKEIQEIEATLANMPDEKEVEEKTELEEEQNESEIQEPEIVPIKVAEEEILSNENITVEAPENINVENLIEENISTEEKAVLQAEFPNKNVVEIVKEEVVKELNNKTEIPVEKTGKNKKEGVLQKVGRKIKKTFLALLAVSFFETNTSFVFPESEDAVAYDKIKVENLDDWKNIKLDQEAINKLDNISIINEAHEKSDAKYFIVDKSVGMVHFYQSGNLISTYEVGTGENEGDEQTVTVVKNGRVYWDQGNKKTGAGIYTINKKRRYGGLPSFTMLNERGIEVPTVFHKAPAGRAKFFKKESKKTRMSNGCINFQAGGLEELSGRLAMEKDNGKGIKVYILPDDPHNKFEIVDGELRFLSNRQNVNKTIKRYEPKPIILKAEDVNNVGKEFLQNIAENKAKLMSLYPTVSNDVYNELTRTAYGIFGQESTFGTYGKLHGQIGRVRDRIGAEIGRNVSAGVTQIRITSISQKVKDAFDIHETKDLFNIKKSAPATMSMLLDIYTENIPESRKGDYEELVPMCYNSPVNYRKIMESNKKIESAYLKSIKNYSKKVRIYVSNY